MGPGGVPVNSTHQATTNIYISTLEFNPVLTSHRGEYTCQATSSAGTVMADVVLTVQSEHTVFVMVQWGETFVTGGHLLITWWLVELVVIQHVYK